MLLEREEVLKMFADNLRAERARKYYTQEYLAEKASITQEHLSRLENAAYSPSLVIIANLAIALQVNVSRLITLEKYIKE